jgi:hypothetical protein
MIPYENPRFPVHELVRQPIGQWEEAAEQQLQKIYERISSLKKQECMVRIRHLPTVHVVPEQKE